MGNDDLREALAALEHEQWAHWMRRLFEKGEWRHAGFVIHEEDADRWYRQMEAAYANLTEAEKDRDREWADKVLVLIGPALADAVSAERQRCTGIVQAAREEGDHDHRSMLYRIKAGL